MDQSDCLLARIVKRLPEKLPIGPIRLFVLIFVGDTSFLPMREISLYLWFKHLSSQTSLQGGPSYLDSWVGLTDFGCSTICLVLLGLMGNWQEWLSKWARLWNIKVNPTQLSNQMDHTVIMIPQLL